MKIQPGKGERKVICKPITSEPPEQIHQYRYLGDDQFQQS